MPSLSANLHFALDLSVRGAVRARHALTGHTPSNEGLGASLPGGQVHMRAEIVTDRDGFEYLRSGDTKHSLWRTVEWKLLRTHMAGMPRPYLDLGCGDGQFGALITDAIEYGVDGDADAVGACDRSLYQNVYAADLREPLPVPDGSVTTAFSNSTLEHVAPLAPAITSVCRALRPGGRLVATVPTDGLTQAMASAYGAGYAHRMNTVFGHHNLWPWDRWEKLLRAEGFQTVTFRGYLSRPAIRWYSQRSLAPWPQLARRRRDWLWSHDVAQLRRYIEESLRVSDESETTCVLIDAIKG